MVEALDGARDEIKRRIMWPYEDGKIEENGDVDIFKDVWQ